VPRSEPKKPRPTQGEQDAAAPSETELQRQRADSEGMTPNKSQPQHASKNQGEGNRIADRSYRKGIKRFLAEGRAEGAAKKAECAVDGEEGAELRRAEKLGKRGEHR
jgi:hypothetical protein